MLRNGFAKRQNSLGIAVMGIVEINLSLDLFLDVLGDREIRFSQITFDDPFPLIFEESDLRSNLKGVLCID
jgi:hypothetical protein